MESHRERMFVVEEIRGGGGWDEKGRGEGGELQRGC